MVQESIHTLLQREKMVLKFQLRYIKEPGQTIRSMELENKIILVSVTTMVTGKMERNTEKVSWSTIIKMSIQANGNLARKMERVPIFSSRLVWNSLELSKLETLFTVNGSTKMAHTSKETTTIINQKELVSGTLQMETLLRASTHK